MNQREFVSKNSGRVIYRAVLKNKPMIIQCPFCGSEVGARSGKDGGASGCSHYDGFGYNYSTRKYDHYFV